MKKIDEFIEGYSREEKEYVILRSLLEVDDDEEISFILNNCTVSNPYKLLCSSFFIKRWIQRNKTIGDTISNCYEDDQDYKTIISKLSNLSLELYCNDSLSVANLYTYLLWNGYFSKDKKLAFSSENDLLCPEFDSHSIMSGTGVCRNFSSMLNDLLEERNYSSAQVICTMTGKKTNGYKPPIKRAFLDKSKDKNMIYSLLFGNHIINLIGDQSDIYGYDSTNLLLLGLESMTKAQIINGNKSIMLKPHLSFAYNDFDNHTLISLLVNPDLSCPYDLEEFKANWSYMIDLLSSNVRLLDDFYDDIKENILVVDAANQKVKKILN